MAVHRVEAHERDDFAVRQQPPAAHALPATGQLDLAGPAGVRLALLDGQLAVTGVTDVWCQCFTVFPPRPNVTVLRLAVGQWGRWRLNFRLWEDYDQSEWRYQKWVVNVAHLAGPPPPELFRTTGPAVTADHLVQLAQPTRWGRQALRSPRRP